MAAQSVAVCLLLIVSYFSASADAPWSSYGPPPVQGFRLYPPAQHRAAFRMEQPHSYSSTSQPEVEDSDEDANPSSSLVGSLLSLVPGGLSGILGLSSASFRSKRSLTDPQTQADFVDYVLEKKKELVSGIARDAIFFAHRNKPAASAWVKDKLYSLLSGTYSESPSYAPSSDYDSSHPSEYPVDQPEWGSDQLSPYPVQHQPAVQAPNYDLPLQYIRTQF